MSNRIIAEYTDIANGYLRSGNWVGSTTLSLPYATALAACTNAYAGPITVGPAYTSNPLASNANYPLVTDTAVLNFITAGLNRVQVTIPSPVAAIFGADGVTVDSSNPLVAALIVAATGYLSDVGANLVTSFMQGVKSSRRVEQNG